MAKAWQLVVGVLILLGVPAAVGAAWRSFATTHKVEALLLAVVWLLICALAVVLQKALAAPFNRRLAQAGNAADRAAGWWLSGYRHRYRQWVVDSRRYLDIKDLATSGDHTPELGDVYVDVALVKSAPQRVSGNPIGEIPEDAAGRHSLGEFLDRADRVVLAVLGPAGSGKSTLLAHEALRNASSRLGRLPVLLPLREHGATIAADPGVKLPDLIRAAVQGVPGTEPDGWWDRQLDQGRCLVMLDGLDEVAADEDRRAVATWVERQVASYPRNNVVITSRPHGFPSLIIKQASVLAIRPFTSEQIAWFLQRWYFATERHATSATTKDQRRAAQMLATEKADELIALLRGHPALRDLTVNPLLLTMIATVHRYRGALPGSRAELYGEICQVMLSRRIQAKNLPAILPWAIKRKVLAALAYQMSLEHVTELPEAGALALIDAALARVPHPVPGPDFLLDISNNGLLISPTEGHHAFPHRTFQEYLTAQHVKDTPGAVQTLVHAVEDSWWRETILLYAATTDANEVVGACLARDSTAALSLAFDCAEISHDLAPELRGRLNQARDDAFKPDCTPERRRLIAGVLATQLTRETVITESGARVCTRPVPSDLYWLYLQDSGAPRPDAPCDPAPDRPALGMWANEAEDFIRWLNRLTADTGQPGFCIPQVADLVGVGNALRGNLTSAITSVWSVPAPGPDSRTLRLWRPSDRPAAHDVTRRQIETAVTADVLQTDILNPARYARVINCAIKILVAVRPETEEAASDVLRIVLHNSQEAARLAASTAVRAIASKLADHARRSAGAALNSRAASNLFRDQATQLLRGAAIEIGLDPENFTNLLLGRTGPQPFSPPDFDAAYAYAMSALNDQLANLHGIPGIPLRWLIEGPLGRSTGYAYGYGAELSGRAASFADSLISGANLLLSQNCDHALDRSGQSSAALLNRADSTGPQAAPTDSRGFFLPSSALDIAGSANASLLVTAADGMSPLAATLRILALGLAADSAYEPIHEPFRSLAAKVTLLQLRSREEVAIGECIVAALE